MNFFKLWATIFAVYEAKDMLEDYNNRPAKPEKRKKGEYRAGIDSKRDSYNYCESIGVNNPDGSINMKLLDEYIAMRKREDDAKK